MILPWGLQLSLSSGFHLDVLCALVCLLCPAISDQTVKFPESWDHILYNSIFTKAYSDRHTGDVP